MSDDAKPAMVFPWEGLTLAGLLSLPRLVIPAGVSSGKFGGSVTRSLVMLTNFVKIRGKNYVRDSNRTNPNTISTEGRTG